MIGSNSSVYGILSLIQLLWERSGFETGIGLKLFQLHLLDLLFSLLAYSCVHSKMVILVLGIAFFLGIKVLKLI